MILRKPATCCQLVATTNVWRPLRSRESLTSRQGSRSSRCFTSSALRYWVTSSTICSRSSDIGSLAVALVKKTPPGRSALWTWSKRQRSRRAAGTRQGRC